jgi:DNA-binding protein HU-beta
MARGVAAKKTTTKATTEKTAPVKKAVALLTTSILADHIADTFEMPKTHGKAIVDEVLDAIVKNLSKGGKVQLRGLGVFEVKKRAARKGRNPATGEAIKIKATKRVAFKTARDLKEKI